MSTDRDHGGSVQIRLADLVVSCDSAGLVRFTRATAGWVEGAQSRDGPNTSPCVAPVTPRVVNGRPLATTNVATFTAPP